ncbi:MAG: hypothetical protein K8R92_05305 [Planctomycetes bacterium]|nr:hypothetical protein [Planctomycetota bacterium]
MKRIPPAIILLVAWAALATGCSSGPDMILESDVPAPPSMESRHSANIDQRSGTLDGGLFTFRGAIPDTVEFADKAVAMFQGQGWHVTKREVHPTSGSLFFRKGDREAELNFRAGQLNPSMSEATVIIRPVK